MKTQKLYFYTFSFLVTLFLAASCSGPKQVFYFKPAPATPKIAPEPVISEPVYTASTGTKTQELPVLDIDQQGKEAVAKPMTRKEMGKLVKQTLKTLRDSTDAKSGKKSISLSANRNKINDLKSDMKGLKNSVKVEKGDDKTVVKVDKSVPSLNQTEWILVGIAALLVLLILLSLPVLGTILGVVLGLAIIGLAVALLTGVIEIDGF